MIEKSDKTYKKHLIESKKDDTLIVIAEK